jgi:hypothetical protein
MFFDKIKRYRLSSNNPEVSTEAKKARILKLIAKQNHKSTYHGKACRVCGTNRRYVINNNCTNCVSINYSTKK